MSNTEQFTVGHIPYLNCVPFFHYLSESGFCGRLVSGVPSELNRMLQHAELDVSPSSSFEYARNWRDYLILPEHSISSIGPVESVLLFSPVPLSELAGKTIAITGDSATSINLLRVILREFVQLEEVRDDVPQRPVENVISAGQPALLIGDRALKAAADPSHNMTIYDLGQLWYEYTELPFVFALWMVRRESYALHAQELNGLEQQLSDSRSRFFSQMDQLAKELCQESGLTTQEKIEYWHSINYELGKKHLQGLQLFFDLCLKYKLLEESPKIEFLREE